MARVIFTSHLGGIAPKGAPDFPGGTVGEVLQACFAAHPGLGHYILDDQGRIRKHVLLFADGCRLGAATALDHVLEAESELYVMQALSGGQGEPG